MTLEAETAALHCRLRRASDSRVSVRSRSGRRRAWHQKAWRSRGKRSALAYGRIQKCCVSWSVHWPKPAVLQNAHIPSRPAPLQCSHALALSDTWWRCLYPTTFHLLAPAAAEHPMGECVLLFFFVFQRVGCCFCCFRLPPQLLPGCSGRPLN